jgi:hypothetical protein
VLSTEVIADAAAGFSRFVLYQARTDLGVRLQRVPGVGARHTWLLTLQLRTTELNQGGRPSENPSHEGRGLPTLADLGLSYNQSHRWQKIDLIPTDIFYGRPTARLDDL